MTAPLNGVQWMRQPWSGASVIFLAVVALVVAIVIIAKPAAYSYSDGGFTLTLVGKRHCLHLHGPEVSQEKFYHVHISPADDRGVDVFVYQMRDGLLVERYPFRRFGRHPMHVEIFAHDVLEIVDQNSAIVARLRATCD